MEAEYKDFLDNVGTEFTAARELDGNALVLELVSVTPLPSTGVGQRAQPFSLEFRGPNEPLLEQRIHSLEHDELGALELFLVPLGPDSETGRMRYEAIFN